MGLFKAQVELANDSAFAEEKFVNTFWFRSAAPVAEPLALDAIRDRLRAFYVGIQTYISPVVDQAASRIKVYNMESNPPRAVIREETLGTFVPGATGQLPNEVAICLSFSGAIVSGANRARRRGRVFLGPLGTNALSTGASGAVVHVNAQGAIRSQGQVLRDANNTDVWWIIRSRMDNTDTTVLSGWVDQAFDIQRRRGIKPISRLTF